MARIAAIDVSIIGALDASGTQQPSPAVCNTKTQDINVLDFALVCARQTVVKEAGVTLEQIAPLSALEFALSL
jgi:hypothetical protein